MDIIDDLEGKNKNRKLNTFINVTKKKTYDKLIVIIA